MTCRTASAKLHQESRERYSKGSLNQINEKIVNVHAGGARGSRASGVAMPAGVALNAVQAPPATTYEQFLEYAAGNMGAARKPHQTASHAGGGKNRRTNNSSSHSSERLSKSQWNCPGCKSSNYHFLFKHDHPDVDKRELVRVKCLQCNKPRPGYEQ